MTVPLADRTAALSAALDAGAGLLPEDVARAGRAVLDRVGERVGLSGEHTVVALAGSTGSGKSSLFNALVGRELAPSGVQRPTTAEALAAVRGPGADPLLDWLGVRRRHRLDEDDRAPGAAAAPGRPRRAAAGRDATAAAGGLVLLDLPDHDSVVTEHRLRAEHLVERADLLVWVVDPQKYADAALHERYLRPLARHGDVVVLVLNQADRLAPDEVHAVLDDLRRLAAEDGLPGVRALAVSARTGQGLPALVELLDEAAARRRAAVRRLEADVATAADEVLRACGASADGHGAAPRPGSGRPARRADAAGEDARVAALTDALADAAGVPAVVSAVYRAVLRQATARAGWPPVRWLARLRPDPLRRLHLGPLAAGRVDRPGRGSGGPGGAGGAVERRSRRRGDTRAEATRPGADPAHPGSTDRTSLPPAGPAARASAATAVRRYVDAATADVPDDWALAARARTGTPDLADDLDRAVGGVRLLPDRPPGWVRLLGALQAVLLAAAVAGLLWLSALAGMAYLRLPEPRTPEWGPLPVPTALAAGGLLAGALLAVLAAALARLSARRRARIARVRLVAAVEQVARARVVAPVAGVTGALAECRAQAARAAGGRMR